MNKRAMLKISWTLHKAGRFVVEYAATLGKLERLAAEPTKVDPTSKVPQGKPAGKAEKHLLEILERETEVRELCQFILEQIRFIGEIHKAKPDVISTDALEDLKALYEVLTTTEDRMNQVATRLNYELKRKPEQSDRIYWISYHTDDNTFGLWEKGDQLEDSGYSESEMRGLLATLKITSDIIDSTIANAKSDPDAIIPVPGFNTKQGILDKEAFAVSNPRLQVLLNKIEEHSGDVSDEAIVNYRLLHTLTEEEETLLEQWLSDPQSIAARLEKQAVIRKTPDKEEWCVYSHKGKSMGCYDYKEKAESRLSQVEMFKHMKDGSEEERLWA